LDLGASSSSYKNQHDFDLKPQMIGFWYQFALNSTLALKNGIGSFDSAELQWRVPFGTVLHDSIACFK
jgi:hypothetical protein